MITKANRIMRTFKFLVGDVNYSEHGGTWYKRIGQHVYHVMELSPWVKADGKEFIASLSEIDLLQVSEELLSDALESSGYSNKPTDELIQLECLHLDGYGAPLNSWLGKNWKKLMTEARKLSATLVYLPRLRHEALTRPINALGTTALEYSRGNVLKGLDRCVEDKITTHTFDVKFDALKSTDPIAFSTGITSALSGNELPLEEREEFSEEYLRGYQIGIKILAGKEQLPEGIQAV